MDLELTGDDAAKEQVGKGSERVTSDSAMESQTIAAEGELHNGTPADISQNTNEVTKGEDEADNSNFLKDAKEVWPTQRRVHNFYFPKYRSFEDPKLKAKIEEADKDIPKKTNARFQIIEKLKAKRSERATVISQLKSLTVKDKEYRSIILLKRKEMEPLQAALGEFRSANIAARQKGMGLCSSEEELDDTIHSLNYRIQHESLTLNEEKKLIKEIKQLEGTREKVIANATTRAKIQDSLGHKESIQGQVKLITGDIDEVRKEHLSLKAEINVLESQLEKIDDAISSLQKELDTANERKNKAYDVLNELRKSNNEKNGSYFKNRSLLNSARDLAAKKDLASLQELYDSEMENFMSQWSSSNDFREDYEKRILTSLDFRQLSRDGRMRNPDEKPIVVKPPAPKEPEAAPAKVAVKQSKENVHLHPQHDVVPPNTQDDHFKKSKAVEAVGKTTKTDDKSNAPKPRKAEKEASNSDDTDVAKLKPEKSEKEPPMVDEIDAEKLKEIIREEQITKAKLAYERKKKQAEKAEAKAAARAEKEAEKKLKEKEKKAKKKAAEILTPNPFEEIDTSANAAEQEETNENVETASVPVVERNKAPKEKIRTRNRPRGRDAVPKVILKKKKENSYWLWAAAVPAAVAVVALVILGYYYFVRK